MTTIETSYAAWRQRVASELKGADFEAALVRRVPAGVEGGVRVEPLYTADHPAPVALSGSARAIPRHRDRALGWGRCQRYAEHDLAALHRALLADLAGGVDGVWLVWAGGHGGGAPIKRLTDLDRALGGLYPEAVTLLLDAGADALPAAALMLAWLGELGTDPAAVALRCGADPLATLARDGRLPGSVSELESEMAALARHCAAHLPRARAVTVSTLPYHGGGAHPAQELGIAAATIAAYLRALIAGGLTANQAAAQIELRVAVGSDLFLEVAKLRALRLVWAKLVAAFGGEPAAPELHVVTAPRTFSRQTPWINALRATGEVLAAALGGADRVTCLGMEEQDGAPSERARRLARNTHAVLAEESHLAAVDDPAGGSYYVEALTAHLARDGWGRMQAIERRGGLAGCLLDGSLQREVAASWRQWRSALERGEQVLTGLGGFARSDSDADERAERAPAGDSPTASQGTQLEPSGASMPPLPELIAAASSAGLPELRARLRRGAATHAVAIPQHRDSAGAVARVDEPAGEDA
jgi:methylmalonyl-CoA mutase